MIIRRRPSGRSPIEVNAASQRTPTETVSTERLGTGTASATTYLRGDQTWATIAGGGDVTKVGTPVNNQVGVWTGDGTIEGDADLTFDGTTLAAAQVTVTDDAYAVGWNASTQVPTKNAVYDKIETLQPLDADLTAVAGLASSGLIARTGAGTASARTITGTASKITVTDGDGVAANPTITIPDTPTLVTPTIASFTNATHTHQAAASGGTLVAKASGLPLCRWTPGDAEYPAASAGTPDLRNQHPCIDLAVAESIRFAGVLKGYGGGGVTIDVLYRMTSATANSVRLDTSFERVGEEVQDVDADSFAAVVAGSNQTVPATSGHEKKFTNAHTDGAQMDSTANGERFRLDILRVTTGADAAGDLEISEVILRET